MNGVILGGIGAVALVIWLIRRAVQSRRTPRPREEVDQAELEAAEREVRDDAGEDWGPGAARHSPRS